MGLGSTSPVNEFLVSVFTCQTLLVDRKRSTRTHTQELANIFLLIEPKPAKNYCYDGKVRYHRLPLLIIIVLVYCNVLDRTRKRQ